jgi:teichuronic acid biosynthesis glycosyltransferase TuaG
MPLISVVIPFHSDLEKLRQAVISVCNQKLHNVTVSFEIVIGNDSGLTLAELRDSLAPLVPPLYSLVVVGNKYKRGPGGNRNSAIEASSGSYIAFLDSDDTWEPMKTWFQYQLIAQGANFVATAYFFSEDKTLISPPKRLSGFESIFYSWSPIGTSTVIVTRSLLPPKPFTSLWFCQDLVLWSQLLGKSNCHYASVNIALAHYSKNSGRSSKSSIFELLGSHYSASTLSGLSNLEAYLASLLYLLRAFKNKIIRPLLQVFDLLLCRLLDRLSWFRFFVKIFFYLTQSLFFDFVHSTSTCRRRKFDGEYKASNPNDIYYVAVNTDIFLDAVKRSYQFIADIGLCPSGFQFVDLGAGKGKSLLLLLLKFRDHLSQYSALGIDISKPLLDEAYSNIQSFQFDAPVKLINADASQCFDSVESDNLILYAYNPFGPRVLERVIEGLRGASHILFVYIEPVNSDSLYRLGFTRIYHRKKRSFETKAREFALFYRPPANGRTEFV